MTEAICNKGSKMSILLSLFLPSNFLGDLAEKTSRLRSCVSTIEPHLKVTEFLSPKRTPATSARKVSYTRPTVHNLNFSG